MGAWYNEIDPFAAEWLRGLERTGRIAPGVVDTRSIVDLPRDEIDCKPDEQRHFFAGIGGWSLALRLAGWPDDLGVWTGSCPCQPWSSAGRGKGSDDERHLWPDWFGLIEKHRPPVVFIEQVSSPGGRAWLDLVSADLEGAGYAIGAVDLCAAGLGAPHLRQRLFGVALADGERLERVRLHLRERRSRPRVLEAAGSGEAGFVADDTRSGRREGWQASRADGAGSPDDCAHSVAAGVALGDTGSERSRWNSGSVLGPQGESGRERLAARRESHELEPTSAARYVGDSDEGERLERLRDETGLREPGGQHARAPGQRASAASARGRDPWANVRWLPCTDGKLRPVEGPVELGALQVANGVPARVERRSTDSDFTHPLSFNEAGRVGKLRGYGNAIVPSVAATFIEAVIEELLEGP